MWLMNSAMNHEMMTLLSFEMIQLMHVLATSKHNKKEGNLNKGLLIQK
jgi:hypothetical protein